MPESKVSDMAGTHTFGFDRVFGPNVRQSDIFGEVAKPVVDGIFIYWRFIILRSFKWIQWNSILLRSNR